jgi:predicted metallo-beta-lactamase superfamily hydrolase
MGEESGMQVRLVAFESMGVRSMCTHVVTGDVSVVIDAGVACHERSGVLPHPLEYEALVRKRGEILSLSRDADLVVVSHYHIHHFSLPVDDLATTFCTRPMSDEIFSGKALFCKDPERSVTEIQRKRGLEFRRVYGQGSPRYEVVDGRSFVFGGTRISFSKPLWHGPEGTVQGWVVGTCIEDGEATLVHASDVQLLDQGCVDWMLGQEPDIAIAAGPPFFDPARVGEEEERVATGLLRQLSGGVPRVVVDHQALRSDDWRRFLDSGGIGVMCAAQAEGESPRPLESMRSRLYEEMDVEEGFHQELARGVVPDRLRSLLLAQGLEGFYREQLG